jgi:hypothetical protein
MINPIGYSTNFYPAVGSNAIGQAVNPVNKTNGVNRIDEKSTIETGKVKPSECQTCKNRKYVDQSNENVSFKTPTHISPEASFSAVSSHEQEHVSNAISKGSSGDNQLISASVTLKMAICPECGTPYIAGGVTSSLIKYVESNPYEQTRKSAEGSMLKGMYVDYVA